MPNITGVINAVFGCGGQQADNLAAALSADQKTELAEMYQNHASGDAIKNFVLAAGDDSPPAAAPPAAAAVVDLDGLDFGPDLETDGDE